MIPLKLLNDSGADEVLISAEVELAIRYTDARSNYMYMLAGLVVMEDIATEMSITEAHSLHVVVSNKLPLLITD